MIDICFVINHVNSGGAQRLLEEIINDADDDINFTVCFFDGCQEAIKRLKDAGAEAVEFSTEMSVLQFDPRGPLQMWQYFRDREFDIIHAHLPYSQVLSRVVALQNDATVISTQHSVPSNYFPLERWLESATRPLDDVTTFVSEGVNEAFSWDIGETQKIYNGIAVEQFHNKVAEESRDEIRSELEIDQSATIYLNIGHFNPVKRQEDIIRAMDTVVEADENSHLLLVGKGLEKNLKDIIEQHSLENHITCLGGVSPDDIHKYYAVADCYVIASDYEGMPMTLLEAMAARLPVVATDAPGVREFIQPGRTGLICPTRSPSQLADAMTAACRDDMHSDLGKNGYNMVKEQYNIEQITEEYLTLYRSLSQDSTHQKKTKKEVKI